MTLWEPDVANEGSFVEDESSSRGCFEGGIGDFFENYSVNNEEDNAYQCEKETKVDSENDNFILGRKQQVNVNHVNNDVDVDKNYLGCEKGVDFKVDQNIHVEQETQVHQELSGEDAKYISQEHDQTESNSLINDSNLSKPSGFGGKRFQESRGAF
ncbi:unnamed protein product [Lactuca saligna]|uniref:Uncharacterized protein n=1 Tax=Lactuca saligna TaxID=75948 RepID=A0AA36E8V1_LACSI|nr:unnamed protein product [Lactuca saligna]